MHTEVFVNERYDVEDLLQNPPAKIKKVLGKGTGNETDITEIPN